MKPSESLNRAKRCIILLFAFMIMMLPWWGSELYSLQEKERQDKPVLDVPYEPTTYGIAAEMLNLANVTSIDTVYDLGCGDGRIVIMAAKERKARGVGVDLDPERIRESKENAKAAGVSGLVQFYEQNLFDTEISSATAMMLYLWPEINIKLRPKLMRELKPGTRIVSHSHTMGDWKPDAQKRVEGHSLYLFIVPANVTGTWQLAGPNKNPAFFRFTQRFQVINGSLSSDPGTDAQPITKGSLKGNAIRFTIERVHDQGARNIIMFEGSVRGDSMEGKMKNHLGYTLGTWKAVRDAATVVPIAE